MNKKDISKNLIEIIKKVIFFKFIAFIAAEVKSLSDRKEFRRYFFNTSWMYAERIFRLIINFFVAVWVIRFLGPKNYGLLSYSQSFVFLFSAVSIMGLDVIVVKELVKSKNPQDVGTILGTSFVLKLLGSLIVLPIILITSFIVKNDRYTDIIIFIISFALIFQSFNVIDYYFKSKVLAKYVSVANSISILISSIIKIFLILYNAPLIFFAGIISVEYLIIAINYIIFYKKTENNINIKKWKFDFKMAKYLLKNGFPLFLTGFTLSVGMSIDQLAVKWFLNYKSVGLFATGEKLIRVVSFLPYIIGESLFPKILNMDLKSKTGRDSMIKIYGIPFWGMMLSSLVIFIISKPIIYLLFGSKFAESIIVLRILIWTIPLLYIGTISTRILIKDGLTYLTFFRQLSLTVLVVILNILLIPLFGIAGSAIATLSADFLVNVFFEAFFNKTRYINKFVLGLIRMNSI